MAVVSRVSLETGETPAPQRPLPIMTDDSESDDDGERKVKLIDGAGNVEWVDPDDADVPDAERDFLEELEESEEDTE